MLSECLTGNIVNRKFVSRQNTNIVRCFRTSLCIRIKVLDRFDFVVKEIQTKRCFDTHGEDVDDTASHTEFARSDYLLDSTVTGSDKIGFQLLCANRLSDFEKEGVARNKTLRTDFLRCRDGSGNKRMDVFALRQTIKGLDTFAHQVGMWTHGVVGQCFPVGKCHGVQCRIKPRQFFR